MAKKDFNNIPNATLDYFISDESKGKVDGKPKQKAQPKGYKPNPDFIETKSKRVQVLVQPSVYDKVKAKAEAKGISTNEAINEALKKYTER